MAGKNKTFAWENIKWIKAHLPLWEKKGMSKAFLNSIIKVRYKGVEADVESVITCDPNIFETLYNQKDFLEALKAICKRYRMPYGKVPKEMETAAEDAADIVYPDFAGVRPRRLESGKRGKINKDVKAQLEKKGYNIKNAVANSEELYNIVMKYNMSHPGVAKLFWSPELIELFVDMFEEGRCKEEMVDIIGEDIKLSTIGKYESALTSCKILIRSAGRSKDVRFANEDIVEFIGGRKRNSFDSSFDNFLMSSELPQIHGQQK